MSNIWSGKAPDRCNSCYRKIENVFYDAKIWACEGFSRQQVCEACFKRNSMLGRAEGDRYERDDSGKYCKTHESR